MARTKNRGEINALSPFYTQAPVWRLGKYLRLSKDDFKRGTLKDRDKAKTISDSIENQRKILNEFELANIDEFECSEEYKDDGFTGTDADRDDFQRLLADVRAGKINCVIIKDLSRLSRDYVEAGILIDRLFVQMNVRFISLHERIDSYKDPDSVSSIVVPITNVMNDQYCYQTSKKIRQVFDMKRRNGEFIAPFAPHGYIKDPKDKHKIIVDEEAAEVVKKIFAMFLDGMSKNAIAVYCNDHGIPTASEYKRSKGMVYKTQLTVGKPLWTTAAIDKILKNCLYTGDMVQGRRRVKSYKIHEIENIPESEWIIVENTHEAIIEKQTFDKVQKMLKRDTRTAPGEKKVYLFSGFLKCADCGKAVIRGNSGGNVRYFCSTYKMSRTRCTMHSIPHNRLEAAVLYAVQQQVYLAVTYSEIVANINMAPLKKSQSARLDGLIAENEKALAKITRYKQALYEDWKDGELSHSDYKQMREDYEKQATTINAIIDNLKAEQSEVENGVDTENLFLTSFSKYENIDKLTREILIELVDHIKIYEGGDISIKFKFADEYRRVAEYIEANKQKAAV